MTREGVVVTSVTTLSSVTPWMDGSWSDVGVCTWFCKELSKMNMVFSSVTADFTFCDYSCVCLVSVFDNDISYKPSVV